MNLIKTIARPQRFEVWTEGYSTTGMYSRAQYHGEFEATSFAEACADYARSTGEPKYFDKDNLTYFGCRFYDNELQARKSFG